MTEKLREIDRLAKASMLRPPSQKESIAYLKSLKGRRFGGYQVDVQGVNLHEKKSNSFFQNVLRRRALNRQRIIAQKCMEMFKSGAPKGYTYSECMASKRG
ncbi:Oidioi.mRNA.OKI2018_I69.PAR.g12842.t1.cds [Oikopleura dioica]|uniref:Oidioi.mRNA.OKI2018_I69.PAR.g12842.t1.cds n=1 Tax=Oikopleura dioica TaxID=34765 RepID=A0ABN7S6N8_OIKDI|nr:Oidioi.mRNA.OKI2018_I69.PAR.g12842.t1.cds [Oikopleura dioica]